MRAYGKIPKIVVLAIFEACWKTDESIVEIAGRFGVSDSAVSCIKHRDRHRRTTAHLAHLAVSKIIPILGEEWRIVTSFPSYSVSNMGRIKRRIGGWAGSVERLLQPCLGASGYLLVILHSDGGRKPRSIHRLVAEAFLPVLDGKEHVNHIDANKMNNRLDNLEWVTPKENIDHAIKLGRRPARKSA